MDCRLTSSAQEDGYAVSSDIRVPAALDPINERSVQQALRELTHNKTLIVVAHRLQTVQAADQIIVLDNGGIVERGSHDDLLQLEGRYAAFWNERVRAAGWRLGPEQAAVPAD